MSERSAMFLIVVGLLLTAGGVGGTEQALSDSDLLSSLAVAVTGLLIMGAGVLGLRNKHFG